MAYISQMNIGGTLYDINVAEMIGATSSSDGVGGSTPTPHAGDEAKYLTGGGAYEHPPVYITDTEWSSITTALQ